MRVDKRALVRKLTPTGTRMLERAASRAYNAQHSEIMAEHLLAEILDDAEGDAAGMLEACGIDRVALLAKVAKVLVRAKSGHSGRPTFSSTVSRWLQDAWLRASVELGETKLRTGALLLQFIAESDRYSSTEFPEFDDLSMDKLVADFDSMMSKSPETIEAAPTPGADGVPARVAGREASEALDRFTIDFTAQAREHLDPVFGREDEIRQMIDVLARRRKNNPLLVGEPGVGKTAIVEGLARLVVENRVPSVLAGVEIRGLDLGLLQAGAGVKGEFENRVKSVLAAVRASPVPIILFIDEAHTLIGAGGAAGSGDAANLLKPPLARGELRTIGATTWAEYKEHIEKDPALERRFELVKVEPPSVKTAITMLRGLRPRYEESHGVVIRDEAVQAAVELSDRYLSGRQLPDKAVGLLDTAAARVRVARDAAPDRIEQLRAGLAAAERAKTALERDREDGEPIDEELLAELAQEQADLQTELEAYEKRWAEEKALAQAIADAHDAWRAAVDGTPVSDEEGSEAEDEDAESAEAAPPEAAEPDPAKVEAARAALDEARAAFRTHMADVEAPLVFADVTAQSVAQVVAGWTGIPVGRVEKDSVSSLLVLEDRLRSRVKGQDHALSSVADALRASQSGLRDPKTPTGVFLFVGPSGVGKTETALALAEAIYGGERFITTINMSEFQEKHTVSRLIGSPPGYVGYGKGGVLTEAVRQRPYSVVLLDECEKADLEVMNLFYQVFDKGSLTDGTGREIDFRNTVVILTSNLASETVMRMCLANPEISVDEVTEAIRPQLSAHFKPALLARMTVVPFRAMDPGVLTEVVRLKVGALTRRMTEAHGLRAEVTDAFIERVVGRCTEPELGARAVDHVLRGSVVPAASRKLLEALAAGAELERIELGVDAQGALSVEVF